MMSMKYSLGALLLTGMCLSASGEITVQKNGQSPTVCPQRGVTYIDSDCVVSGRSDGEGVRLQVTKSCTVTFDDLHFSSSEDGFTPVSISDGISVQILLKGSNSISPGQGACAIYVPENSTLTIDSAARADGGAVPELRVVGRWNCAAIGGHGPCTNNGNTRCDGGNVVINGGKIVAEGDPHHWGHALGGSWGSRAGDVTINGGTLELKTPGTIDARKTTINGGSLKLAGKEGIITYTTESATDTRLTEVCNSHGDVLQCVELTVDKSVAPGMKVFFPEETYGCKDIEYIGNSVFLWLSKASHQLQVRGAGSVTTYSLNWQGSAFKVSASAVASSQVMFDGTLVREGRLLGNTNATAVIRVNGDDHTLDVKTDADGRFAASLPGSATPAATVTLRQITVGGETVPFDRTLTVPKLPSALKAEYADVVMADSEVTVVDSEVTVSGDLRLTGTSLGEMSGQLERVVNGGITVGRPSPAKASYLNSVTAPAATRIYGIGAPIVEMDAEIKGKIEMTNPYSSAYNTRLGFLYAYLSPKSSATINGKVFYGDGMSGPENPDCPVTYTISKAQNFGYVLANSAFFPAEKLSDMEKYRIAPQDLYKLFVDSKKNFVDYTAPADGFVTVSVSAADKTFGGIAVSMDFSDRDTTPEKPEWYWPFALGWHRSPGAAVEYPGNMTDRHSAQLPKFDRAYTAVMRKGDHMHLRVLLEPNLGFQDPDVNTDIDLRVKVVFRPLGFAE